uniref:CRIB domain-containing protein n=1 Tax=Denticeps clupeoides TaxID=299321 RepID=A0AAY4CRR6_9TELE
MPILKQLVSSSAQSKRRSRADLTVEMISAPLGDFRHTMHVGRGGDAFGDTSFLSSRSGEPHRRRRSSVPAPRNKASCPGPSAAASSIMSFHIDLGPSMLGDILSVMDKKERLYFSIKPKVVPHVQPPRFCLMGFYERIKRTEVARGC